MSGIIAPLSKIILLLTCFLYTPAFLLNESPTGSVRIRCHHPAASYSWSKSDDGSEANAVILDTSLSDKYTVVNGGNSLDIRFNSIAGADGGLYRCVYGGTATISELCVYVYGESMLMLQL